MPYEPRKTALYILNRLTQGRLTMDNVIDDVLGKDSKLTRRDRALVNALVYGVTRWRGQLDWIIDHFSKIRLNKIDPRILNVLRLGLFQIKFLNRIPISAAVNTSVDMAKSFAAPWVAGYVNAILRNAAKGYKTVPYPAPEQNPVLALSAEKSFPEWLIKKWLGRFGFHETERLCDAINTIPPITIRTNTLKIKRENLFKSLAEEAEKIGCTPYSHEGISFYNPKTSIAEMKAFQNGYFQVQDEAAQLVTLILDPQPNDIVLDACAGMGGKTGHIAQLMQNSGKIIAIDQDDKKLRQLSIEMDRLGVSIITPMKHDLNKAINNKNLGMFDRILLDAPCSGLGVLQRNPDIKWSVSKKYLQRFQERQNKFLDKLSPLVKPSGVMVYAVCSTEPEENEEVVKTFLQKHPKFVIDFIPKGLAGKAGSLMNENGYLRTFPHHNKMDGFFSVCFRRIK